MQKNTPSSQVHMEYSPTPVLLPGKSHGRQSLVGYRPWGRKESDTTERLHFSLQVSEEAGLVFLLSYSVLVSMVMSLRSTKGSLTKGWGKVAFMLTAMSDN